MIMRQPWLLAACASVLLGSCEDPTSSLSKRLAVGMTEAQVSALRPPDRVTLQTCGSNTPKPWQCKVYQYGGASLWVAFREAEPDIWVVNSWW
jgi:hypothetical protein